MRIKDLFTSNQPRLPRQRLLLATGGVMLIVGVLALLGDALSLLTLFIAFAPSCLLVFTLPEAPVSQPAAVVGGHLIAALVGVIAAYTLTARWWTIAIAAGISVFAMAVTRLIHPPAIANTMVAFVSGAEWPFLLLPVLTASTVIVLIGLAWHRLTGTQYPAPGLLDGGRKTAR